MRKCKVNSMAIKKYEAPEKGNTSGFRHKNGKLNARYSLTERQRVLKVLQQNGFNYAMTERQTGISTVTIKKWRTEHPEVFNNSYTSNTLAVIEHVAKEESLKITKQSGDLLKKSLDRAGELLENETDLAKVSSFIRAITPLAKVLDEVDNKNGYEKVSSLTQTLEKLAKLNGAGIEDIEPD